MKVLFIARSTLDSTRGGDTTQVHRTAAELRNLGMSVDIVLAGTRVVTNQYDIIHLFNIIRPADLLAYTANCSVPIVISTIYLDYSEYDQKARGGIASAVAKFVGKFQAEYLKTWLRALKGQDKLHSKSYLLGHRLGMRTLASRAALLLPNSTNEAERFFEDMGRKYPFVSIPNGVDQDVLNYKPKGERNAKQVLCVAQIEGRKNQHLLIEAIKQLDADLVIVGKASPNNISYEQYCRSIASNQVKFTGYISREELLELYHTSAVHVLPSWFETTGLSSLEAASAGCNLVVSDRGDTHEYFDGYAEFCVPDDVDSITEAIKRAMVKPSTIEFQSLIRTRYTWQAAAKATLEAYKSVLP